MIKKLYFASAFSLLCLSISQGHPRLEKQANPFQKSFWEEFHSMMESRFEQKGNNIHIGDNKIVLTYEVPGMSKKDILISVKNQNLIIQAAQEKKYDQKNKKAESYYHAKKSFYKSIALPQDALVEKISATVLHGILTISIPRKETPPKKSIKIQVN